MWTPEYSLTKRNVKTPIITGFMLQHINTLPLPKNRAKLSSMLINSLSLHMAFDKENQYFGSVNKIRKLAG